VDQAVFRLYREVLRVFQDGADGWKRKGMYHAPDSSVSRRSTNWPSLSFSSTGCLPMASPPSRCAGPLRDAHDGGRTPRRKSGEGAKANGELHAEEYASTGIRSKGAATVREMRIVVAAESRAAGARAAHAAGAGGTGGHGCGGPFRPHCGGGGSLASSASLRLSRTVPGVNGERRPARKPQVTSGISSK